MCFVMAVAIIVVGIICLFFFLLDFSYRATISDFLWHSLSRAVALDTHDPLNKVPPPEQGQLTEPPLSHSPRPIPTQCLTSGPITLLQITLTHRRPFHLWRPYPSPPLTVDSRPTQLTVAICPTLHLPYIRGALSSFSLPALDR